MDSNIQKTVNELKRTRDELRLQAHLFKAEAKDTWDAAEKNWSNFQSSVNKVEKSLDESSKDVSAAVQLLADEIKNSYEKISAILRR
jgi:hypothetical protein